MQDVHYIGAGAGGGGGGGGGGRFFGGGDRRLRPHNQHQALKCPRCESLNTKFCYYNNYNLSQPRHFCKNCRRYWTKGGVLRNVPVGGGCRKAKRSKQKCSASSSGEGAAGDRSSAVQSPSSESSSLTATPTTAAAAAEEGSAPITAAAAYSFANARFLVGHPSFDDQPIVNQATDGQIFPAESFTSLMTSSTDMIGFGLPGIQTASYERAAPPGNRVPASENPAPVISDQAAEEFKMQELNEEGLAAALDWGGEGVGGGGGEDQGLFDLTAAVDSAYWTPSQWTDSENPSVTFLP